MKVNLTDRFVAGAKAGASGRSDYFDSMARVSRFNACETKLAA
jgi:hypothetical protein